MEIIEGWKSSNYLFETKSHQTQICLSISSITHTKMAYFKPKYINLHSSLYGKPLRTHIFPQQSVIFNLVFDYFCDTVG